MRTYLTEFPDYDDCLPVAELLELGFTDESWHNDSCPRFRDEARKFTLWIDYRAADMREVFEEFRVCLGSETEYGEEWETILGTNDLSQAIEYIRNLK